MKYLELLRAQRAAKIVERDAHLAALDEIATASEERTGDDKGKFTEDEQAKIAEHRAGVTAIAKVLDGDADEQGLDARIAELEAEEGRAAAAAKAPTLVRQPDPVTPTEVRGMSRGEVRGAALAILDEAPDHLVSDRNKARINALIDTNSNGFDGDHIARRLVLTENEHYRSAFVKAVTKPSPVFTPEEARALVAFDEFRAMSIGTDAAGGFGVPVIIDPTIIITSGALSAPVLGISRIETITNDEWKGVSSAGVAWSWDAEAAAVSDDSPTLAQPVVTTYMARGFIPYSIEVGMDYPGFANEMSKLLDQGYIDLLATTTITGTGSAQPFGIVVALDANTFSEVVVGTDGAFTAPDIDKVWKSLPERFRSRATWLMSVDVENEIRGFGSGTATSRFTVDQTEAGISRLNGRPVVITDYMPEFINTTGAGNILVVGDFNNYLVAQRAGMSVELIPMLFDVTNNRPTGQRGWFAWARLGADSVNDNGFRLLQNQ